MHMITFPRSCCHVTQHVWATRSQTKLVPTPWEGICGGCEVLNRKPVKNFVTCILVSNWREDIFASRTRFDSLNKLFIENYSPNFNKWREFLFAFSGKKNPMIFHKSQKGNIRDIIYTQTERIIHRVPKEIFPIKWCIVLSRSQIFRRPQHPAAPAESSSLLKT